MQEWIGDSITIAVRCVIVYILLLRNNYYSNYLIYNFWHWNIFQHEFWIHLQLVQIMNTVCTSSVSVYISMHHVSVRLSPTLLLYNSLSHSDHYFLLVHPQSKVSYKYSITCCANCLYAIEHAEFNIIASQI